MRFKPALMAIPLLLSMMAPSARAAVVDFNDKTTSVGGFNSIIGPYAEFQWSNFFVQDPTDSSVNGTGFKLYENQGTVGFKGFNEPSPTIASFSASTAFVLNGFDLNSVYSDALRVTVEGFRGDASAASFTKVLDLDRTGIDHYDLNWDNINRVSFTTAKGTDKQFVIDNIQYNVSAVPEPESYALMLAGLGLMGWMRRRKASAVV